MLETGYMSLKIRTNGGLCKEGNEPLELLKSKLFSYKITQERIL